VVYLVHAAKKQGKSAQFASNTEIANILAPLSLLMLLTRIVSIGQRIEGSVTSLYQLTVADSTHPERLLLAHRAVRRFLQPAITI
jgi:hypothetical protein